MSAVTPHAGGRVIDDADRGARARLQAFRYLLMSALAISAAMLAILLYTIGRDGIGQIDYRFLNEAASFNPEKAGIYPAILGTLWLMALTALFIVPVGIAAAVSVGDTIGAQILARIGNDYVRVFTTFGLMAVGAAVIAFLFVPRLKKMMAGVH